MHDDLADEFLTQTLATFRNHKRLADEAIAQVSDAELFAVIDEEANSIAVICCHLAGNLRSRWTDFLTTDGEKADRHRDAEFALDQSTTRADVLAQWEAGCQCVCDALAALTPADLRRTVTIRGEAHTVVKATQRSLAHFASHVGQIVLLAKHFASARWQTLSIARGQSEQFNRRASLGGSSAGRE